MASFGSKDKANFDHHVPCQNNIHVHVFIAKFWAKPAKNKGERPQKLDSLAELISQQKWISPEIEGNEFDWNKELGYEVKTCQNWVPKRLEGWDPTSYLHKALRGELVRPQQRVRQNGIGFNWSRTHRKIAASKKMMINSRNCGYCFQTHQKNANNLGYIQIEFCAKQLSSAGEMTPTFQPRLISVINVTLVCYWTANNRHNHLFCLKSWSI